jgi:hypothetical protein
MHQNYHFIAMLSQMHLHVSAHQHHHQRAYKILTSYCRCALQKNVGVSSEVAPISNFAIWM